MPHRSNPNRGWPIARQPHEILGLSPREDDAVKVIEVAHVLLRRWRRVPLAAEGGESAPRSGDAQNRIREIVAAREAMLEQIYARWVAE